MEQIKKLITISRPRFWLYIVGPYLVGAVAAVSAPAEFITFRNLLGGLFFLIIGNLYLYGINDCFDSDTDQYNPKKQRQEHLLRAREKTLLLRALAFCGIVYIVFGVLVLRQAPARLALFMFFSLSTVYSAPPLRLKARAWWDSISNVLYILPGVISYVEITGHFPLWGVCVAGGLWAIAMHLFSAIPDIEADLKAGLMTSAIRLGRRRALAACGVIWAMSVLWCYYTTQHLYSILGVMYVGVAALAFMGWVSEHKIYWFFPWINGILGGVLFWTIVFEKWGYLIW